MLLGLSHITYSKSQLKIPKKRKKKEMKMKSISLKNQKNFNIQVEKMKNVVKKVMRLLKYINVCLQFNYTSNVSSNSS